MIPWHCERVSSRNLNGEIHLKRCLEFRGRFAKRVWHVPSLPAAVDGTVLIMV